MEPDDLLCSCNAWSQKTLARDDDTYRRASGWAGEKVARSGRPSSPPSRERAGHLPLFFRHQIWFLHIPALSTGRITWYW